MFVIHAGIWRKTFAHVRQSVLFRSGPFLSFFLTAQNFDCGCHLQYKRNTYATQYNSLIHHDVSVIYTLLVCSLLRKCCHFLSISGDNEYLIPRSHSFQWDRAFIIHDFWFVLKKCKSWRHVMTVSIYA